VVSARCARARARRVGVAAALVAGFALALTPTSPAGASSLTGCSGSAASLDGSGNVIDSANAAGGAVTDTMTGQPAFTKKNPFVVDNRGVVEYQGRTDAVITDHSWSVSLLGLEVLSGGSANESQTQEDSGSVDLDDKLPVKFTGLIRVEGTLSGTGGECTGDGFIKLQGNPFASPVTWAGLTAASAGGLGIFLSLPRVRPVKGA
jgi:hypothetical protein